MKYIILVLFGFGIIPAFAEGQYSESFPTIFYPPNICAVEFDGEWIQKSVVEEFLEEARISAAEWEVKLKNAEHSRNNHHLWEVEFEKISLDEIDSFDYSLCDIIIQFEEKPEKPSEYFTVLGDAITEHDQTIITVYYAKIATCQTEDDRYFYYDPCYLEWPRTPGQIGTVIRHELGHAFGLGHYYSESDSVNQNWASGTSPSPSVMVIFTSDNPQTQQIRDIDIAKLHSIYGGFGFKSGFQLQSESEIIQNQTNVEEFEFPQWVKKNAKKWSEGKANDEIIFGVLDYFVISEMVSVPVPEGLAKPESKVPQWFKNTAGWWADGLIQDEQFFAGIEFLVEKNIIS